MGVALQRWWGRVIYLLYWLLSFHYLCSCSWSSELGLLPPSLSGLGVAGEGGRADVISSNVRV